MKEYIKPDLEIIRFSSENITDYSGDTDTESWGGSVDED